MEPHFSIYLTFRGSPKAMKFLRVLKTPLPRAVIGLGQFMFSYVKVNLILKTTVSGWVVGWLEKTGIQPSHLLS